MKHLERIGFDYRYTTSTGINANVLAKAKDYYHIVKYLDKISVYDKLSKYQTDESTDNCLICYNSNEKICIMCKHKHIVHMQCQILSNKPNCLYCFEKYY